MKQYVKFHSNALTEKVRKLPASTEFADVCRKYLADEGMGLYWIDRASDEYRYAHELALMFTENFGESGNFYVSESDMILTKYDKRDYEVAEAFCLNFIHMVYVDDNVDYTECCNSPKWHISNGVEPDAKYLCLSKTSWGKRDYATSDYGGMLFSENVVKKVIEGGLANYDEFHEVNSEKGDFVCYYLCPKNRYRGFAKDNQMTLVDRCENCGKERYNPTEEPYFISRENILKLKAFNITEECIGPVIENYSSKMMDSFSYYNGSRQMVIEPMYIVNKECYNFLKKNYSRMQFIPIFRLA